MMNKINIQTSECTNCGTTTDHRWLIHHVRHRGVYRRLCTSCVLKMHPDSFCAVCFDLLEPNMQPRHVDRVDRVGCMNCPSVVHPNCIPNEKPYNCLACSNPSFPYFDIKMKTEEGGGGGIKMKAEEGGGGGGKAIDKRAALMLLCAAKIAAASMSKAMVVARAEAERRVREAAMSRKRAREALEHVSSVVAKEKARKYKDGLVEGSGSVHVVPNEKTLIEGNGGIVASFAEQIKIENKVAKSSSEVSANLYKVGSREKEGIHESSTKNMALGSPKNGATVPVKVEDGGESPSIINHGTVSQMGGMSKNVAGLNNNNAEGEKANGLLPGQLHPVESQLQHK